MLCEHLDPLDRALQASGIRETSRGQAWSDKCREWVYYECLLDIAEIRSRFKLDDCVIDHENFGTHGGQEEGLYCTVHFDGVMGIHKRSKTGLVLQTFPQMEIDAGRIGRSPFSPSDSWLLLSILMASGSKPASVRDIIATGDYINHAVLKFEEFAGGARRLYERGIIKKVGRRFAVMAKFARLHAKEPVGKLGVTAKTDAVDRALESWKPPPRRTRCELLITRDEYDSALREYIEGFWGISPRR